MVFYHRMTHFLIEPYMSKHVRIQLPKCYPRTDGPRREKVSDGPRCSSRHKTSAGLLSVIGRLLPGPPPPDAGETFPDNTETSEPLRAIREFNGFPATARTSAASLFWIMHLRNIGLYGLIELPNRSPCSLSL
ncbi:hypothetical protein J6590_050108 [Homalodisca vitripennis]|nr:hypothetical protein J6590_050108 [Homalodisca vitripennis]